MGEFGKNLGFKQDKNKMFLLRMLSQESNLVFLQEYFEMLTDVKIPAEMLFLGIKHRAGMTNDVEKEFLKNMRESLKYDVLEHYDSLLSVENIGVEKDEKILEVDKDTVDGLVKKFGNMGYDDFMDWLDGYDGEDLEVQINMFKKHKELAEYVKIMEIKLK